MVSGKPLLGLTPHERLRVWLWNGEDPMDELQRRIMAAVKYHNLQREDIEGYLFVNSGRSSPITLAAMDGRAAKVDVQSKNEIIANILDNRIDLVVIDPLIASHMVNENENGPIALVAETWADIAEQTNCAIELVHHTRKMIGEATHDDARGASALVNASRSARVLNRMTEHEATSFKVENRRLYFRVDNGKSNMAKPADAANWFRMASIDLCNGEKGLSDNVGVVTNWKPPAVDADVDFTALRRVQEAVDNDGPWRADIRVKDKWVGVAVASALGLDLTNTQHKKKIRELVKKWIEDGRLRNYEDTDEHRETKTFVKVGKWIEKGEQEPF
ncbi:MAG: AAA family ATPase [Beijerinckiaceae bacterium]|nr:AAA family ATPase [Beijerinckiaceae bacterium]